MLDQFIQCSILHMDRGPGHTRRSALGTDTDHVSTTLGVCAVGVCFCSHKSGVLVPKLGIYSALHFGLHSQKSKIKIDAVRGRASGGAARARRAVALHALSLPLATRLSSSWFGFRF